MDMRVMLQVLSPGVKHAEQTDVGTQMLRVATDFEQRSGTCAEEQVVEQLLVLEHESRESVRQRKDDMEVGCGQQLG